MPGFYLYSGNRQEQLLEALAKVIRQPLQHPLRAEAIVVQHLGMQRWVSLGLAKHNGIEANTEFLLPNKLLEKAFKQGIPDYQSTETLEPDQLAWILFEILQNQQNTPRFAQLSDYLKESDPLKIWQLAKRIADLFDQYGMFRPEMILKWEAGATENWQALLWRAIPATMRQRYKPFLRNTFLTQAKTAFSKENDFPERISVFGISALPPLSVEILTALAHHTDIHFFFLAPTEIAQATEQSEISGMDSENTLLASLGKHGKNFFQLMHDRGLFEQQKNLKDSGKNHFNLSSKNSLLAEIQNDILQRSNPFEEHGKRKKVVEADHSIQIHSCHSRMREVEVLHDQLLHMMDQDPDLKPGDILVMTPQIDDYVPFIQSVFSSEINGRIFPFSIADRGSREESKIIQYLFRLLEMIQSRFTVTEVLELLESEAIRARFQLSSTDLELIQKWIGRSNIRWGIDEAFRKIHETPATRENTWQFGIDRILTGYAMPGNGEILFEEVLPFDDIEGNDSLVFGRFLEFFDRLTALVGDGNFSLKQDRTLKEWVGYLRQLINAFFEKAEEWESELTLLWQVGEDLEKIAETSQLECRIDVAVLTDYLEEKLDHEMKKMGFLGYGTTFCSMLPMRSIPFQVIVLLGMNETAFPRLRHPLSFDLMARKKELGDRSLKDEDRYFFLETILCCRKTLYISYLGQEIRNNTTLLPSTLVSELIEYIEQNYDLTREKLVIPHKLQAFNPLYFQKEGRLFSYSEDNWQAAKELTGQASRSAHSFEILLPDPMLETASGADSRKSWLEVDIEQLVRFFGNPAQFIFNQRLGVRLGDFEELPKDEEPFSIDALSKYAIQSEQLEYILDERPPGLLRKIAKARGDLPLGHAGEFAWNEINRESYQFAKSLRDDLNAESLEPLQYDLHLENVHLRGTIAGIRANGLVRYRPARIKIKDRLQIWLDQLLLHLQSPKNFPLQAILIGKGAPNKPSERLISERIETPQRYLSELLTFYKKGLQEPLAFFPESANAYMKEWVKGNADKARDKARAAWYGDYNPGEIEKNAYFKRCFAHLDLIEEMDFEQNTLTILEPLFAHQKDDK